MRTVVPKTALHIACGSALVLLTLALPGCITLIQNAVHGRVRGERFTFRDSARIDSMKLKLQGYYSQGRYRMGGKAYKWPEHVSKPLMLWEDGTALYASIGGLGKDDNAYNRDFESGHATYVHALTEDLSRERNENMWWLGNWGAFRIRGDSISIQIMYNRVVQSEFTPSYAVEFNGEILNDSTFVLRERVPGEGDRDTTRMEETYHFRRLRESEKPDPKNWTHTHPDLQ